MTDTQASLLDPAIAEGDPKQLVDLYADRLMDEIFDGVDRALEGDADALQSLQHPVAEVADPVPEFAATAFNPGGLSSVLFPTAAPLSTGETLNNMTLSYALATAAVPAEAMPNQRRWWQRWSGNRLLLGAAGLSLAATLGLWWFYQRQTTTPAVVTAPAPATVATSPDVEFLEYLRRSLEVIAQDAAAPAAGPGLGLPDVPVAFNGSPLGLPPLGGTLPPGVALPGGPAQINVIERVYIPYQTGPAPVASGTAPAAPSSSGLPAPSAAPVAAQTLVGILELGDRSAALFEISGVPQRVYIGERIGSSGWSLVSVSDGEAVVRRNGEVRSIYIGQQF